MTDVLVAARTRSFSWITMAAITVVLALSAALGVSVATRSASPVRSITQQVSGETCISGFPARAC